MTHQVAIYCLILIAILTSPVLAANADLAISKSDGQTLAAQGDTLTYTVIASNLGPDDALGAAVADILPNDLLNVTWTCAASAGSTCPASGSGDLSVAVDLLAGGTATFTLLGTLAEDATGSVHNSASILSPGGVSDPNPGNNSATDVTELTALVDLFIDLDVGEATAVPGESLSYLLVVGNSGPEAANDVQVMSQFAPGLGCQWQCVPSGGASCGTVNGSGDLAQTVDLPVTSRLTYSVDCQIPSHLSATLVSQAAVSAGSNATEHQLGNNIDTISTELDPVADVAITVSDGRTTAIPGADSIQYDLTVSNNGPSDVTSVVVQDDFPQLLGDLPWTCLAAGTASCTATGSGDILDTIVLPAGTSVTYFASASLPSDVQGTLSNQASVTPPNTVSDPNENNNQASDVTALTPQVDLRVTKTDGVATAAPGTDLTYLVQIFNQGPSDAPQSSVQDVLPTDLSCTWTCLASPGASCQSTGNGDLAQTVDLASGSQLTYEIACQIDDQASGTLSNTAQATPALGISEINGADNNATDLTELSAEADLRVTVSDQLTSAVPGTSLTYRLQVDNLGPSQVTDAQVSDTFPFDLDCGWTCQGSDGGQCTPGQILGNIDDTATLPVGGQVVYVATCEIDSAASGTLVNEASVISTHATDPFPGDNVASDSDTLLTPQVDLAIAKSDGLEHASAGETVTYSMLVSNAGPSDATAAQVSDFFPPQVNAVAWSCDAEPGASCNAGGSGDIAETVDVAAGSQLTFSAVATLGSDATGTLSNTALVSVGATDQDLNLANNNATDTTLLETQVDLVVHNSDGLTSAVPGRRITYLVTVDNAGPGDALGAMVTDTFSQDLTDIQWTCVTSGGASCLATGSGDLAQQVDLPAVSSLTFTVDALITSGATGTLSNTASVEVPDGITDINLSNNVASDVDTVLHPEADLVLTLDDGSATAVPGLGVVYQLTISQTGPSDAPSSRVSAVLDEALTCQWTCQPSNGGSCAANPGSGDLLDVVQLPAGSELSYVAACAIAPAAVGDLVLDAEVSTAPSVTDPDLNNNSFSEVDLLTPRAEVVISKTDGQNVATPGDSLVYTIRVRNLGGPSDAPDVTVSDTFPDVMSCLWSCQGQGGALCSQGQTQGNLLDIAQLPVDSEAVYTAECSLADDAGDASSSVVNSATATVPPGVTDSNASNNSALDITQLLPLVDLAVEVSDGVETAVPGESVTYSLRVRHLSGPLIENAEVRDHFPAELDCLWTCQGIGGGICTPGQVHGDIVDQVDLPVGSEVLYSAVCAIAPDARQPIENTATVELPADAHDPDVSNNSSSDLDTALTPVVDVAITNSDGVTSVLPGDEVVYNIDVSNEGPSSVDGVRVEDLFPTDLDCTWTCATFEGASCTAGPIGGDLVDLVDLPPASQVVYEATCTVLAAAGSTLSNTATVELPVGVEDSNPLNDQATDDDTRVEIVTDLSLRLDNGQDLTVPGTSTTYSLEIQRSPDLFFLRPSDLGLADGPGYHLWRVDPLDGVAEVIAEVPGGSCERLAWHRNAQGARTLGALCSVSQEQPEAWRPLEPMRPGDLEEVQTVDLPDLTSTVVELAVQSILPNTLGCTWTCLATPGSSCNGGPLEGSLNDSATLAAGGMLSYAATCEVDPAATGDLSLGAQLVLPPGVIDPTEDDHQATDADLLEPRADLRLSKSDGTTEATPGGSVTYTLIADNMGPSDVPSAIVSDIFSDLLSCLWTCVASETASCAAGQVAGDLIDTAQLPAGAQATYSAVCQIDDDASGTLANTAQLTAQGSVSEIDPSNNTASDLDTTLMPQGDLSVTVSDGTQSAIPGESLTYSIEVANMGPSQLSGVQVEDLFPTELACVWSCQAGAGASCAAGQTAGDLDDSIFLPSGGSVLYTAQCLIDPGVRGVLINEARVMAPAGASDPDLDNNISRDDDTELQSVADLAISKSDGVTQVAPGDGLVYTLIVANDGPSNDSAAQVQDIFAEVLDCQWTCQPSPGTVCTQGPVIGDLLDVAQLPAGGSATYTATCQLSTEASGPLLNNATVTPGDGVDDPNGNNNSAADLDEVIPLADLSLSKTDGVDEAIPGESVTYTLVAANLQGPSPVIGAQLSDQVSGRLDCAWTCSSTGNANCGSNTATGDLSALIDLPVGGVVTWQGECDIAADATGTLANTAVLSLPEGVLDLHPDNNTASDTDTQLVPTADLAVSKDDGVDEVLAGDTVTYTMVATNLGPSDATGAILSDPFPPELSCSWSCQAGNGATCTEGPLEGDLLDDLELTVGSQATYTATCVVANDALGEINNTVTIDAGDLVDPDASNNSASDVDTLLDTADLTLSLVDAPDPVTPNGMLLYGLSIGNLGPAAEANATVTLSLPAFVTLQSVVIGGPEVIFADGFESGNIAAWGAAGGITSSCQQVGETLTCELGVLVEGETLDVTLTAHVDTNAAGVLVLSATVDGDGGDPVSSNDTATELTTVGSSGGGR